MGVTLDPLTNVTSLNDLTSRIRYILQDLEDQLNQRSQVYVSVNGTVPSNTNSGDIVVVAYQGSIQFLVRGVRDYTTMTAAMLGGLMALGTTFKGIQEGTAPPAVADFPKAGDFGFFHNSSAPSWSLCVNFNGSVIKTVALT